MSSKSTFNSRVAHIKAAPATVYAFISDLRNFTHLIPEGFLDDWQADKGTCSFKVSPLGKATVRISDIDPGKYVVYSGAVEKICFGIDAILSGKEGDSSSIQIRIETVMDPFLKLLAGPQIEKGLEKLMDQIEKFNGWEEVAL